MRNFWEANWKFILVQAVSLAFLAGSAWVLSGTHINKSQALELIEKNTVSQVEFAKLAMTVSFMREDQKRVADKIDAMNDKLESMFWSVLPKEGKASGPGNNHVITP